MSMLRFIAARFRLPNAVHFAMVLTGRPAQCALAKYVCAFQCFSFPLTPPPSHKRQHGLNRNPIRYESMLLTARALSFLASTWSISVSHLVLTDISPHRSSKPCLFLAKRIRTSPLRENRPETIRIMYSAATDTSERVRARRKRRVDVRESSSDSMRLVLLRHPRQPQVPNLKIGHHSSGYGVCSLDARATRDMRSAKLLL